MAWLKVEFPALKFGGILGLVCKANISSLSKQSYKEITISQHFDSEFGHLSDPFRYFSHDGLMQF